MLEFGELIFIVLRKGNSTFRQTVSPCIFTSVSMVYVLGYAGDHTMVWDNELHGSCNLVRICFMEIIGAEGT